MTETPDKTVILTVGLPRAGKTTWARRQPYPVVSIDAARIVIAGKHEPDSVEQEWVHYFVGCFVRVLLLSCDTVVIDGMFHTAERRRQWQSNQWTTWFKVIDTPAVACLSRAQVTDDVNVSWIIERIADEFEPLNDDETKRMWDDR